MSKHDGTHYPDLSPLPFGGMKEIKRLPQMQRHAPKIKWGDVYLGLEFDKEKGRRWNDKDRLKYAEALASSMNHAADILQQERNKLFGVVEHLETQIKENVKAYVGQGDLMHKELGNADVEKQELYQLIVDLKQKVKAQAKRIRELEAKNGA